MFAYIKNLNQVIALHSNRPRYPLSSLSPSSSSSESLSSEESESSFPPSCNTLLKHFCRDFKSSIAFGKSERHDLLLQSFIPLSREQILHVSATPGVVDSFSRRPWRTSHVISTSPCLNTRRDFLERVLVPRSPGRSKAIRQRRSCRPSRLI
ncbi:hypothetical protein KC328_g87 [Hortaea werneckii]|nr:hypothetical protein KC328_g87 [Hortaea werneckii]